MPCMKSCIQLTTYRMAGSDEFAIKRNLRY